MPQRTSKGPAPCAGPASTSVAALFTYGCAAAHDVDKARAAERVTLRITAVGAPVYCLDVEADAAAALSKLDTFLRDTWVESAST